MAKAETGAGAVRVSNTNTAAPSDSVSGAYVRASFTTRVSMTEEPGAGKPHAGICAGGRRVTGVPTATV